MNSPAHGKRQPEREKGRVMVFQDAPVHLFAALVGCNNTKAPWAGPF